MSEADRRSWFEQKDRIKALHRLADNHANDWLRRDRTYDRHFGADLADPDGERHLHRRSEEALPLWAHVIRQEETALLHASLKILTPLERDLIAAFYWRGESASAIGRVMSSAKLRSGNAWSGHDIG